MSSNVFLISDTHFGHKNICNFLNESGEKLRPWENSDEMDEALILNWNSVVRKQDKVYHLGDVTLSKRFLPIMDSLNGRKVLIKGNHDIFNASEYLKYFSDVRGVHVLDGFILSHIPIHEESVGRFSRNIHGHLHSRRVLKNSEIDNRYISVCVEQINFTPIELGDLKSRLK